MGGKVNASVSRGGTLTGRVTRTGGKVVVGVSVTYSKGLGLGGSASFEMASAGYQNTSTETQTEGATFTLDPDNHAYTEQFALLKSARSVEELRHIRATHEDLVSSYTTGSGEGSTGTTTAGVGPVGLELTDTGTYDQTTSVNEDGARTDSYTGTKGGGAAITGPGGFRMAHSEKDTVAATVGPDNTASGDISTSTSDTSFGASWDALKKAWSDTKFGLATGSAKVMQETAEVCGMKLSDGDFSTIAAVAADPKRWQRVVESPRVFGAWMATGREIAAANGDRQTIARALAVYGANNDGATHALERIVRSAGTAQGGTLYDWPGELSAEKAAYASLITGDPMTAAKTQRDAGDYTAAAATANGIVAKIDAMVAGMRDKQDKFTDGAALGEMLAAAAAKRGEVAREAATFTHRSAGVSTAGVELPPANVTTVPTVEQAAQKEIDQAAGKAELAGLQTALAEFLKRQDKAFVFVKDELDDMYVDTEGIMKALNELRHSVYPSWDKALEQARAAAVRAGVDPWSIQPTPAKGYFNQLYKQAFGTKNDVYEWPPKPKTD
jgi:hypothetical protein